MFSSAPTLQTSTCVRLAMQHEIAGEQSGTDFIEELIVACALTADSHSRKDSAMDQKYNSNPRAQTPIGTLNPTVMRQIQQELRMHGCLDSQNVRVLIGSSQEGRTVIEDTLTGWPAGIDSPGREST